MSYVPEKLDDHLHSAGFGRGPQKHRLIVAGQLRAVEVGGVVRNVAPQANEHVMPGQRLERQVISPDVDRAPVPATT